MANADDESTPESHFGHHRERELAALAGRQLGVVSWEQLKSIGFAPAQVRLRAQDGRLHQLHHDVFAVGHRQLVARAHLLAALLTAGPSSFLSHRTAAAVWGLRAINLRQIEITIPGTGGRRRPHLLAHRTAAQPHPDDLRTIGLLRASSVPRLLVELAPREPPAELERLITVAVQKRLLRLDAGDGRAALEAALARHPRWPGMGRLQAALATYRRTESHASQLELAFDRFLARHPEIPDPERNIHIDGWEIDRYWPACGLVIELDGRPYHVAARDMERDRVKDAALQRLGLTPIRFTDLRFEHDRAGILRDLHHFLNVAAS